MATTRLTQSTHELTKLGGALNFGPDRTRLVLRMMHLLAQGRPVTPTRATQLIRELGADSEQAHQLLQAWTERNDDGDIVGLGISLNKTAHQITIGDTVAYAWCAMDTLFFPIVLDRPIMVESTAPGTHEIVRLKAGPDGVTNLRPAESVITWPLRGNDQADMSTKTGIWASFCHHSFLFPTRGQAQQWATGRHDIEILSLPEGFTVAREIANAWLSHAH
ncbi:MAG TPA: hypothetical protein DGG94_20980 [Micromonosporaceae bacterium]|nr:hypothetical protein [Micromonosporaceae bacterium]HCU52237.1 hypothetical protein [Micromonosporaceae bacterium]